MAENPADLFRILIKRLAKDAADIGLELIQPAVIINPDDDGNDYLQAMFLIQPKAVELPEEKELTEEELAQKAQFEEMMAASERLEREQQNEALREETKGWLDG